MDDIGFILASWVITLGSIGILVVATVRRARKLSQQIPDDDKPWL